MASTKGRGSLRALLRSSRVGELRNRRVRGASGAPVPSAEALRRWLHVPGPLAVPDWVRARLGGSLREASPGGLALERAVFGVVDLETTGLSARDSRILEIGLVVRSGSRSLRRFETLVDIEAPVPAAIVALTGIDDAQLVGAPPELQALERFAGVLAETGVEVLVAHNARFDRSFLEAAWARHGLAPALPPFLCSIKLARRLLRARSYSLGALVAQLGIPRASRHRALGDAEMTLGLLRELLQRARLEGVRTLEALREFESRPKRRGWPSGGRARPPVDAGREVR